MNSEYKTIALKLARIAGEIMRKNFTLGMDDTWKADHSPVTETDLVINTLVLEEIKKNFPGHSILSEEGNDISKDAEYVWICDPVDGTHCFSHGVPTAVFMLALVFKGDPILGVIYDPFLDRMFYAEKGKGAFLNDISIHVSKSNSMTNTVIGMGKLESTKDLISAMREVRKKGVRTMAGLSVGYMGMLVAAGEFSAIIFGGTDPHDTAAIKILVEEAGGRVTDLFGEEQRYDRETKGQLASNGLVHNEILDIIKLCK